MLRVVSQQAGRLIHIVDERIDVTVVVEVSECETAARVWLQNTSSGRHRDIFKFPAAEIAIKHAALLVGVAGNQGFDFRVDVSVHHKDIGPSVAVIVEKSDSLPHVVRADADTGWIDPILERVVPFVHVDVRCFLDEVSLH